MVVGESDFIFNFKTQAEQNVETVGRKYVIREEGQSFAWWDKKSLGERGEGWGST